MGMSEDHSPLEAGCSCEDFGGCLGSSGAAAALLRIAGSGEAQRPRWTLFERAMFSFCCKLDRLARSVPHLCEIGSQGRSSQGTGSGDRHVHSYGQAHVQPSWRYAHFILWGKLWGRLKITSNMLEIKAGSRRGWDSNSRYGYPCKFSRALDGVPGVASLQHRSPVFCGADIPPVDADRLVASSQ